MALNIIWIAFFVIAFVVALCKLIFLGDTEIFKLLADGLFDSAKSSVIDVAFPLAGTMVFFLGLMTIAEKAGAIQKLAKWMYPFLSRLFPEVPQNHPAMGQMVMNFSANMLGLDNAATPFGLKAMESLQSLNPEKEKARLARHAERQAIKRIAEAGREKPELCEICFTNEFKIVFDHCHNSGKFRGWICDRCNRVLGIVKDSPELLRELALYLEQHDVKT